MSKVRPSFGFTYSGSKGVAAGGQQTLSTKGTRPISRKGGAQREVNFFYFFCFSFSLPLKANRSSIHALKVRSCGMLPFGSVSLLKDGIELRTIRYAPLCSHKEVYLVGPSSGIPAVRQWGPPPKIWVCIWRKRWGLQATG